MTQDASVSGSGNLVVQIIGDGNEVLLGSAQASLRLMRYANRRVTNPDELDFLSPYSRALPLVGRKPELETLTRWLDSSRPISIAVWVGLPGTGKTRLALELVERASSQGWSTGFVKSDELARFTQQGASWAWNRKTLVVVDDPVKQAPTLTRWFEALADDEWAPQHPLRILVVERHADQDSGWWQTVFDSHGHDSRMVRRLLDPDRPIVLSQIVDPNEQRQIFSETFDRIRSARTSDPPTAAVFDRASVWLDWLGEPLFLIMAALVASSKGLRYALSLNRTDLADELAKNERDRIQEIARSNNVEPTFLVHMAAIVTLARGMSRTEARTCTGEERVELGFTGNDTDPPRIVGALSEALRTQSDMLLPLTPDTLGEAFIVSALHGADGLSTVLRATKAHAKGVAITTIRIAQDYVGTERSEEIRTWFNTLIDATLPLPLLRDIADTVPSETIALRNEALRLEHIIVEQARDIADARFLAMSLNNLGVRLSAVGRHDEALVTAQEAVAIKRELAAAHPDAFRSDLAVSLINFGLDLNAVGRCDEALTAVQEAVNAYRELTVAHPEFQADLATALNNFGVLLDAVGRGDEALATTQEAVAISRELAAAHPHVRPDLARSLINLGARLNAVDRRDEALAATKEAVDAYRELAAAYPDAFRPDLATSLNNIGLLLGAADRRDEALAAAEEAVTISRDLATAHPHAFRRNLAQSLIDLGARFEAIGRRDEALTAAQEAVDVYRELAAAHPDAFRPDLARSLNRFTLWLDAVGRRDEALAAAKESVDAYRKLAAAHPDAYRPDLPMSLNILGLLLGADDQYDEALAVAQEAVSAYRELAGAQASTFNRASLAISLKLLALVLSSFGRKEEAEVAWAEAAQLKG